MYVLMYVVIDMSSTAIMYTSKCVYTNKSINLFIFIIPLMLQHDLLVHSIWNWNGFIGQVESWVRRVEEKTEAKKEMS